MKRFTDTEKWRDPWYRELPPRLKCFWQFLCDTCDHAGVVQIDWKLASFEIGEPVTDSDLPTFESRIQLLPSGRYLIRKFIPFQFGVLNCACPPHRTVFKLIGIHGITLNGSGYHYPNATLTKTDQNSLPLAYPNVRAQDKDKDKDKDQGRGVGEGDIAETFLPEAAEQEPVDRSRMEKFCVKLRSLYGRKENQPWPNDEEILIASITKRPDYYSEIDLLCDYNSKNQQYFPRSVKKLLETWSSTLDAARRFEIPKESISTKDKIAYLKRTIDGHVANPTSQAYRSNCTPAQKDHFKQAKDRLRLIEKEITEGIINGH